jgi:hydrogenase expression/formation protein
MRVAVLGVGNILMRDEGIGVRAVEELPRRYRLPEEVEVIDGGTAGMELLEDLSDLDHLIIVDAVRSGKAPATIVRLADEEVPALFKLRFSPHQVGLSDVLAALSLTDRSPGSVVVIGVEPVALDTAFELTPPVAAVLPQVVERVADELRGLGLAMEKH